MSQSIIMFLMSDCSKIVSSKRNIAKWSLTSVFTTPLCNGDSIILFVNMSSNIVTPVFVLLFGLFITGKILFWKTIIIIHGLLCFENNLKNLY